MAGVAGRYALGLALPIPDGGLPWATLLINLSGSLAIGLVAAVLDREPGRSALLRPFAITGVLGSFTTYSTFAVETNGLLATRPAAGLMYLVLTLAGGIAAAAAGDRMARA